MLNSKKSAQLASVLFLSAFVSGCPNYPTSTVHSVPSNPPSTSTTTTIPVGVVQSISLSGPVTAQSSDCVPITLSALNAGGATVATATAVSFIFSDLSISSAPSQFYSDNHCQVSVIGGTFQTGQSSQIYYYRNLKPETAVIEANLETSYGAPWTMQLGPVVGTPTRLLSYGNCLHAANALSVTCCRISGFLADSNGNAVIPDWTNSTGVSIQATSGDATFYTDSACQHPIGTTLTFNVAAQASLPNQNYYIRQSAPFDYSVSYQLNGGLAPLLFTYALPEN